jgi:CheY-like chemotaxis protein
MKALRILVVDDNPKNIKAAFKMLEGHEVMPAEGYDLAHEILQSRGDKPDVVLTDVMMPKGGFACMSPKGQCLVMAQGIMPYGPVIALRALCQGVKKVGVITQGNHHDDPFVFAFDHMNGFEGMDLCKREIKVVITNRNGTYVNAETFELEERPDFNEEVLREKFDERLKQGEVIFVKDWKSVFDELMSVEKR